MRVPGSFQSDRVWLKELREAGYYDGPELEPIRYRPSWLQRLFGVRWDRPRPAPERKSG